MTRRIASVAAIIKLSAVAANIVVCNGFQTATPTLGSSYKSQQHHHQRSSRIQIFSLKEDTTSTITDTGRSSSLRSTSQTDALGRQQTKQDTDEGEETNNIPSDVLQSFTLLILSQFVLFLGVGAVIPAIPLYGQSIGLSSASNGIVISTPAVALLLCSRFAGEFADVKRKPAMIIGMAIIAISDAGTTFSNNLATLVVARLGLGLGRGYAEAGERGMLTDLANKAPNLRGRALAIQQASVALGVAIGAPAGGLIVENYGVRSSFLCVSAAALFALCIYLLLPETVVIETQKDDNSTPTKEDRNSAGEADWIELLKTSQTWRSLAFCQSGVSVGYACKIAIIPILASQILGGATGAGLLLSAAGLSGLVGAPIGGILSDKIGSKQAAAISGLISGLALTLIPVGLSLQDNHTGSASFVSIIGGPDATIFSGLVILWAVAVAAQGPALTSLSQQNAPVGAEATALGLPRAFGDATYIAAPLILGAVSDGVGDTIPGVSCAVAGLCIMVGSSALLGVSESEV